MLNFGGNIFDVKTSFVIRTLLTAVASTLKSKCWVHVEFGLRYITSVKTTLYITSDSNHLLNV